MKKIIHIGYLKTGTTWFQYNFFPKVENINYINPIISKEYFISSSKDLSGSGKIKELFLPLDKEITVVSQENLLGGIFMNEDKRIKIAKRLKRFFGDATIIIFIRNQVDLIASAYSMHIKLGGTKLIDDYLFGITKKGAKFPFDFFKFNNKIIKLYKTLFGELNIKFYCYEEFEKNTDFFLNQFIHEHGFEINLNEVTLSKSNIRLRKHLIKLLKFANYFTRRNTTNKDCFMHLPGWFTISRYMFERLNRYSIFGTLPTSEGLLGLKNVCFIKNYYKESNRKFALEFPKILEYNYPL